MIARRFCVVLLLATAGLGAGCGDDPLEPDPPAPWPASSYATPDIVLDALEIIYNDRDHTAEERRDAYASLLWRGSDQVPGFIFRFQTPDIQNGLPESWGMAAEVAAHEAMFTAQKAGEMYSLRLILTLDPTQDLTPPQVGREGWKQILATNVYLRLMFNPNDGLEVSGAQADFIFVPLEGGGWQIADWRDLPRPEPRRWADGETVEPTTWGSIKALYE